MLLTVAQNFKRAGLFPLAIALAWACAACGYHVASSVGNLPAGIRSLGVPTFKNLTQQYRLEQQISGEVIREFSTRTRIPVSSTSSSADAVLLGEIRTISSSPVTFGNDTFGSAFLVTVQLSAKLVRTKDSAVLWQNTDFLFRERYVINNKSVVDFFSEEGPALQRLSRDFAASLVSTVLNQ